MSPTEPPRAPPAPPDGPLPGLLDTPEAGPRAIRGGVLRVIGYGVGLLLSVVSTALLFRHLGVDDAGRYVTILSIVTVAGGLTDAGITTIGVRELALRSGTDRDRLARDLIGLRIVLTVVGVIGAVAFVVVAGYGRTMVLGTVLGGVGLVFLSLQATYATSLMAGLRLGWVTAAELFRQATTVVLIVALVVAGADLLPFIAVQIPSGVAVLVLTAVLVRGDIPLSPAFHAARWRALLRDVLPFSAAVAVHVVYLRVAIVLVSLIATAEETGYFGASFRIVEVIVVIPALLVSAAFPIFARAARHDLGRLRYALGRVFDACVIAGAGVALALGLGAPIAIDIVAGPDFEPAIDVLRIQAAAVGLAFLGALWGYVWLSLGLYRQALFVNTVALLISAPLTAILASSHGATGAAVATVLAEAALGLVAPLVLFRIRPELRPSLRVLAPVALGCALAIAIAFIPGLPTAIALAAGLAIYGTVLAVTRAVPPELLDALLRELGGTRSAEDLRP